jgi:peptidoglycan/xylan/chitin deacetylase (PgdA/CDA1 family)
LHFSAKERFRQPNGIFQRLKNADQADLQRTPEKFTNVMHLQESNPKLLILGLHRVGFPPPNAKIRGLFTSPQMLAFQLMLIRKMGYEFSTLEKALSNPKGKTAVITFDDGYADNFTHALPVLREFDVPATIFVITKNIGQENVVWREAGENLPADIMDWRSLEKLQEHGWEIGSHAHRHIHLARYNEADQESVIWQSIVEIRKNLGVRPVSFAYPYGSYNESTKKILKKLGIKYAVTTNPTERENPFQTEDFLELSRCSIGGYKFHHYLKNLLRMTKIAGAFDPLKSLIFQPQILITHRINIQSLKPLSLYAANNDVMPRQ